MTRILTTKNLTVDDELNISEDELHYLLKVRRHKKGDQIEIQDSDGKIFLSIIKDINKKNAVALINDQTGTAPPPLDVSIITAVPKGKILDNIIRNLSEIGVKRVIPVKCARSAVDADKNKIERWRRISFESMRQCVRKEPLIIEEELFFEEALSYDKRAAKIFMHPYSVDSAGDFLKLRHDVPVLSMTGPEGGFTNEEVALAIDAGFTPLKFGNFILKIETAILTAAVTCAISKGGFD
ncbi:MAG: 16S rRNA (uracil(1498)-N(3))-methyltransferase [Deltaproteobacteria bacterium]|nr:16S rRNA (uracil(1498)-N(3))-methyltransferase [Deltaproteobacteria bacterium]